MAKQLTFDWPTGVALGPEDFFVSEANAQTFAMLQAHDGWPNAKLVIVGPEGSGKSHLSRIFQGWTGATLIHAEDVTLQEPDSSIVIVEDMENLPPHAEEAMFHLHNYLQHKGGVLLMSARSAPARWAINLPDLASRMQATTVSHVRDPDDALLSALLMKLFADRQINPKPDLIAYLATRIERSFAAAAQVVKRLDTAALTMGTKINLKLAKQLLDNTE